MHQTLLISSSRTKTILSTELVILRTTDSFSSLANALDHVLTFFQTEFIIKQTRWNVAEMETRHPARLWIGCWPVEAARRGIRSARYRNSLNC